MTDDTPGDRRGNDLTNTTSALTADIEAAEAPSETVIRAVASLTNTPPLELEPLYGVIDPVHLDALFDNAALADRSLTFTYVGCSVTVTRESIRVREGGGTGDREPSDG